MADPKLDLNYQSGEHMFNQLFRGDRHGLVRAVLRMRELHEGAAGRPGLPWDQIRCEIAANRCSGNEAELYNAVGEALRDYAMSGKPVR